jgi:hypothetical protein
MFVTTTFTEMPFQYPGKTVFSLFWMLMNLIGCPNHTEETDLEIAWNLDFDSSYWFCT